jgi:hypothetical protein
MGGQELPAKRAVTVTDSVDEANSSGACEYTYSVQIFYEKDCLLDDRSPLFSKDGIASSPYSVETKLSPLTRYCWRVQSKLRAGGSTPLALSTSMDLVSGFSSPVFFKTIDPQNVAIPDFFVPSPVTTRAKPSGATVLSISGKNGEAGGVVHLFLHGSSADTDLGSTPVALDGSFQVNINLASYRSLGALAPGEHLFFAKQERNFSGGRLLSEASNYISYYYNPDLTVQPPVIAKRGRDGTYSFSWENDLAHGGPTYHIWRREGFGSCGSPGHSDEICYLGRPFKWVGSTQSASATRLTYDDTVNRRFPLGTIGRDGVSYFVTAQAPSGETSIRSNALTFMDQTPPKRTTETYTFVTSGTTSTGFLCNMKASGYFDGDVSPDLSVRIKAVPSIPGKSCLPREGFSYQSVDWDVQPAFDSLLAGASLATALGSANCIKVAELHGLQPNTNYCFLTCLQDGSSNVEEMCDANGVLAAPDVTNPVFRGVETARALESGTEISVHWKRPEVSEKTFSVRDLKIFWTRERDSQGSPIFKESSEASLSVGLEDEAANISGLQIDSDYWLRMSLVDAQGEHLFDYPTIVHTQNVKPILDNLQILPGSSAEPFKLKIQFKVAGQKAHRIDYHVELDQFQFRIDGKDWTNVDIQELSGSLYDLGASVNSVDSGFYSVEFNTLKYFSGEHELEIQMRAKDSDGVVGDYAKIYHGPVFQGMSAMGSYSNDTLTSCSLNMNAAVPNNLGMFSYLCLGAVVTFLLRRRVRP